jgi:hypothetical protein
MRVSLALAFSVRVNTVHTDSIMSCFILLLSFANRLFNKKSTVVFTIDYKFCRGTYEFGLILLYTVVSTIEIE